ncbi:zinc ribbon domain-containing protein [Candidatus Saccharibacteria bacterium]|nr:zinc ribbon domain-containing protein [Candidatus Saccharibacteria bacterium]
MKRCEKCSTMNEDSVSFCTNCGSPLNAPISAPEFSAAPVAPAKKADIKLIALIGVALVGVIVGVVGIIFALNANKDTKKDEGKGPDTSEVKPQEEPTNGGNTVVVSGNSDSTAVAIGPYKVTIPRDLEYDTSDEVLVIGDKSETWVSYIAYNEGATFHCAYTDIASLGAYLTSEGYGNVKTGVSKANGLDYAYADYLDPKAGSMMVVAYFKAGEYTFATVSTNGKTTIDHSMLNDVARVLSTAKEGKTRDLGFGLDNRGTVDSLDEDILKKANLQDKEEPTSTENE